MLLNRFKDKIKKIRNFLNVNTGYKIEQSKTRIYFLSSSKKLITIPQMKF